MSAAAAISHVDLREALEAALRAEQALRWSVNSDLNGDNERVPNELVEEELDRLAEAQRDADRRLGAHVALIVGDRPWTALLAGHLLISDSEDSLIIVPIEQVHYLDNLRRFP